MATASMFVDSIDFQSLAGKLPITSVIRDTEKWYPRTNLDVWKQIKGFIAHRILSATAWEIHLASSTAAS